MVNIVLHVLLFTSQLRWQKRVSLRHQTAPGGYVVWWRERSSAPPQSLLAPGASLGCVELGSVEFSPHHPTGSPAKVSCSLPSTAFLPHALQGWQERRRLRVFTASPWKMSTPIFLATPPWFVNMAGAAALHAPTFFFLFLSIVFIWTLASNVCLTVLCVKIFLGRFSVVSD